jgi:aminopeptidase N
MVYAKGPYAFHILRETFGDEKLLAFLKNLMAELAGKNIVTRDIQRVAEQSFGGTMEWFFDQWVRGTGIPEYKISYDYRQAEDRSFIVEGNVTQRVVAGLKKHELKDVYYRGIVPITVLGKDGQEYPARVLVEGPDTKFAFKVPVKPTEITLNKYGEILAHPVLETSNR